MATSQYKKRLLRLQFCHGQGVVGLLPDPTAEAYRAGVAHGKQDVAKGRSDVSRPIGVKTNPVVRENAPRRQSRSGSYYWPVQTSRMADTDYAAGYRAGVESARKGKRK